MRPSLQVLQPCFTSLRRAWRDVAQALRRFVRVFQSQQELSTTEPELSASLTGDAVGAAPVTPRQVDSFVQELQAQGVLPSGPGSATRVSMGGSLFRLFQVFHINPPVNGHGVFFGDQNP